MTTLGHKIGRRKKREEKPNKSLPATVCLIALCVLICSEAHADAISLGFLAFLPVAGVAILAPLTAFVVLVEGIFLAIGLRIPYRRVLWPVFVANVASLCAGVPVKISNAWMYWQILPQPLLPHFMNYPWWAVLLGTSIYFLVTLVVEFLVIARWRRKRVIPVSLDRVALFVFYANAATYAVLAPLYYFVTLSASVGPM